MVASAPSVKAELRAELRAQRMKLLRQPELAVPPVDIAMDVKYLFRTEPGAFWGPIAHTLDMPPDEHEFVNPLDEKKMAFFTRKWEKRHPEKGAREYYERLAEKIGGKSIRFSKLGGGAKESYYATNDDEVAAYIRKLIEEKRGEFAHVYEQNGKARWIAGEGTEFAKAFPDTSLGIQAAQRYVAEHNLSDLKRVVE